jgi:urea-proton symporter
MSRYVLPVAEILPEIDLGCRVLVEIMYAYHYSGYSHAQFLQEMLAGNLAAIGVGGIVSVVWSYIVSADLARLSACLSPFLQSPDDFDFAITRAINAPVHFSDVMDAPTEAKEHSETDSKDEKDIKDTVRPVTEEPVTGITTEKDLDPVALEKAFRFAAWSSLALVCSS